LPTITLPRVVAVLVVLLMLQYLLPYLLERYQYALTRGRQQAEYEQALEGLEDMQLSALSAASQLVSQKVGPSVVHIDVRSVRAGRNFSELAQLYGSRIEEQRGQGSGVIVDHEGHIVTNFHVVHGAREIQVSLSDGRALPARIIGVDSLTDLAVLKVAGDGLVPARWGDSDDVRVGAMVWAVGSPFGLQSSITFGIVSAKHRAGMAGEVYQDFLQTDAAVNPGNSGGPLVDAQGQVIGINTAILGESYQGVSFAIPSTVAREVYERLRTTGRVARGWLGVQLGEVSEEAAQRLGLSEARGVLVLGVVDEPDVPCPARDAGILPGDVVISWNGKTVSTSADLIRLVAKTEIGSAAAMVVVRRDRRITVEVTVAERPPFIDL
jgi:S1-C subfamily serine protease